MSIPFHVVQLHLEEQELVEADTMRVLVTVTLALPPEEAGRSRQLLTEVLQKVLHGRWRLMWVMRREDTAGMELIEAAAALRVPEDQASGLSLKLRNAGSAGVKIDLVSVEYKAPTEKLKAAAQAAGRRLYRRALEEAALLNETLPSPECPWEVADVIVDKGG